MHRKLHTTIPIMPIDAVSRTANVERNGGHKWVNSTTSPVVPIAVRALGINEALLGTHPRTPQYDNAARDFTSSTSSPIALTYCT